MQYYIEEKIEEIDRKLSLLFEEVTYAEYLNFINSNKTLKFYDEILGKSDIGKIPRIFRKALTLDMLNKIDELIDKKINTIKRRNLA